jgi:hypothetical protein
VVFVVDEAGAREPTVARLSFGRSVRVGMVLGVVILFVLGATWFWWETEGAWNRVPIQGVEDDGDNLGLRLWAGCFDGELRGSVSENEDRVVVSVEVRGERSENDCLMWASPRSVEASAMRRCHVREASSVRP